MPSRSPPSAVGRLLHLAVFAVLGLSGHLLLARSYVSLVVPQHKAFRSDREFLDGPADLEVVVVGDSMARSAVDPSVLGPSAANLAVGGENLLKNWYRLRWLLEQEPRRIGAVLVPIGPVSFSSWHADDFAPEAVWGRYVDFLEVGRLRDPGERWHWRSAWLKARWFPYVGELRTFNQLRTGRFGFQETLLSGRFGRVPEATRWTMARESAALHYEGQRYDEPTLRWAFERLTSWLRERGIAVVLVAYPVSREYSAAMSTFGAGEAVRQEVLEPLLAGGETTLLDYHNLYFDDPEVFSDPFHLNGVGRAELSLRLLADLRALGLIGGRSAGGAR